MLEENKIIQLKVVAALNNFDWDALSNVMAEDIVETLKNSSIPKAFPDAKLTFLDQIAEGGKVSMRGLFTGTHLGEPYRGISPTGKKCSYEYISIDRIEGGKVVESWVFWDEVNFLQQVGVIPEDLP